MIPFAVAFKSLMAEEKLSGMHYGTVAFIEIMVFIATLVVGYIYVWKKGTFDWGLQARAEAAKKQTDGKTPPSNEASQAKDRGANIMGLENTLFESLAGRGYRQARRRRQLGTKEQPLAGDIRSGVLCDRDDEYGVGAQRSFEVWSRDISCIARGRLT